MDSRGYVCIRSWAMCWCIAPGRDSLVMFTQHWQVLIVLANRIMLQSYLHVCLSVQTTASQHL